MCDNGFHVYSLNRERNSILSLVFDVSPTLINLAYDDASSEKHQFYNGEFFAMSGGRFNLNC